MCCLLFMCVHVCVGERTAGQEKRAEGKGEYNSEKQENGTQNTRGGHMVMIVWVNTKNERNIGKSVKTRTPFLARYGHPWIPQSPKTVIFPDALFLRFPTFYQRFTNVLLKTPSKAFFDGKSNSKGPYQALEKVLTSKKPCIGKLRYLERCNVALFLFDLFGEMPVYFSPSSGNNSSISSFFLDDPVTRITKQEISACRSWSRWTASLEIPSNR